MGDAPLLRDVSAEGFVSFELALKVGIGAAFGFATVRRVLAVANKLPCGKDLRLVECTAYAKQWHTSHTDARGELG